MRYDLGRFRRPMRRSTEGQLMSLTSLGDGSTLTLDFTTGVLDPRLTFTRTSTATFINASGLVATASANSPRFDHDPTTLAPRGLLIEGQAVNLLNWSESFATSGGTNNNWADTNITRNSTNNTDPANGTSALRVTASAGNGTIISTAAIGTSAQRTFSIWLRRVSGTGDIQYTLDNGSTYTTQAITSSWVRYTFAATTAAQRVGIRIVTSGDSIELWGAQLETGSASSYIPTGASQVTRTADFCSIASPNFAPWYGSPTGWTVVTEMTPQSRAAGSFPGMLALRSAADSGLRIYYYNDGTYNTAFRFATASTGAEVFGPNGVTYGVPRKFGASVTSGTQFASSAGVQIGSTQTLAVPMDQTLLAIGSDGVSPTPAVNCRMHFRSIKYWPYAMTLAELNARTT